MFVRRSTYDKLYREALELRIASLEMLAKYNELKRGMDQIAELLGEDAPSSAHKLHKLRLVVNNTKE